MTIAKEKVELGTLQNKSATTKSQSYPITVIEPARRWMAIDWAELWEYRELLYFLIWRDIKVRYKQTFLGATWAVIQPFLTMVVFSIFFGGLAKVPSDQIPYPIFSYTALLPWTFFASGINQASNSLIGSGNLITKTYFPRLIIPLASVLSGLLDFGIAFIVLLGMMWFYHLEPTVAAFLLPIFLILAIVASLGAGIWLAALNVQYRDVRYVVPFLTQFWLFATPIAYPSSLLPKPWQTFYGLNPMAGVVEGFRWALLGSNPPGPMIGISIVVSLFILVTGLYYFRQTEDTFADII